MDRFDENFNDVDKITARPFSSGHPDGVWMIAITYGFLSLAALAGIISGVIQLFSGSFVGAGLVIAGLLSLALYLSVIIFLFKRSTISIAIISVIVGISVLSVLSMFILKNDLAFAVLALTGLHSYILFYVFGLKKDELLK